MQIYELTKLRKYITRNVACLIYKQTILPVVEYADKIDRLRTLQDKAIRTIANKEHPCLDIVALSTHYRIAPLQERRADHPSLILYRLSKDDRYIEKRRPEIHLRNRNKIKFKTHKRVYEKYLKSPHPRGIKMWDRIPESVQRSTTKVQFKKEIQPYIADMLRPILR